MAPIHLKHVVSFSSQDPRHPVDNILGGDSSKKWLCAQGEKSGQLEAIFQLDRSCIITHMDIGTFWAFSVEVLVGRSSWQQNVEYKTLVPSSIFMNPMDCKRGKNKVGMRMFTTENFAAGIVGECWDRVKVVCTQPYRKDVQFGLSVLKVVSADKQQTKTETPLHTISPNRPSTLLSKNNHKFNSPSWKSASEIHKHFFGQKTNSKTSRPTETEVPKSPSEMSRTSKLIKAAVDNTPKYKVIDNTPKVKETTSTEGQGHNENKETITGPRKKKITKTFDEEVRDFLAKLNIKKLISENENLQFSELRHRLEKEKRRKLSKTEKKTFFDLALQSVEENVSESEETDIINGSVSPQKVKINQKNGHSLVGELEEDDLHLELSEMSQQTTTSLHKHGSQVTNSPVHGKQSSSVCKQETKALSSTVYNDKIIKKSSINASSLTSGKISATSPTFMPLSSHKISVNVPTSTSLTSHNDNTICKQSAQLKVNALRSGPKSSANHSQVGMKSIKAGSVKHKLMSISLSSDSMDDDDFNLALSLSPEATPVFRGECFSQCSTNNGDSLIKDESSDDLSTDMISPINCNRTTAQTVNTASNCHGDKSMTPVSHMTQRLVNSMYLSSPTVTKVTNMECDKLVSTPVCSKRALNKLPVSPVLSWQQIVSGRKTSPVLEDHCYSIQPTVNQAIVQAGNQSVTMAGNDSPMTGVKRRAPSSSSSGDISDMSQSERLHGSFSDILCAPKQRRNKKKAIIDDSSQLLTNMSEQREDIRNTTIVKRLHKFSPNDSLVNTKVERTMKEVDNHTVLFPMSTVSNIGQHTATTVSDVKGQGTPTITMRGRNDQVTLGVKVRGRGTPVRGQGTPVRGQGTPVRGRGTPTRDHIEMSTYPDISSTDGQWLNTGQQVIEPKRGRERGQQVIEPKRGRGRGQQVIEPKRGRGRSKTGGYRMEEENTKIVRGRGRGKRGRGRTIVTGSTNSGSSSTSSVTSPSVLSDISVTIPSMTSPIARVTSSPITVDLVPCPMCNGRFPVLDIEQHAATCSLLDGSDDDSSTDSSMDIEYIQSRPGGALVNYNTLLGASRLNESINDSETVSQLARPDVDDCPICGRTFLRSELIVHADRCATQMF